MRDIVRHDDTSDAHRLPGVNREDSHSPRRVRRAVRNCPAVGQQAAQDVIPERVLLRKRLVGGEPDDPEFRRLLVFGLDADVENPVPPQGRVREHDRLSPATVQRLERVGNHGAIEIGQG